MLTVPSSGNSYYLSVLTELLAGTIRQKEQFASYLGYEQKSLLQDLRMKDISCTRSDWINKGRDPSTSTLEDCMYADGGEKYITFEGIPLIELVHKAENVIDRIQILQKFLPYLLEPSKLAATKS